MIRDLTTTWTLATEKTARFADPTMAAAERSVTSSGGLLQIFFSLLIVLGAVFVVAWIVRRMKVTPRSRVGHLKVIDEVVLGNKERAVVLEAEGTRLVLGVGEGRVSLLHRYTSTESSDVAVDLTTAPTPKTPSFLEVLKKGLGR